MAPARKIAREEWSRHKEIIRDLVYKERLPLSKKRSGDSVQGRLKTEHGFIVSPSQLEAYIKKCEDLGSRHVKTEVWKAIHGRLDKLSAMGIIARVSLSGKVFSRAQLSRSKRIADAVYEDEHIDGLTLPFPKTVIIETQGQDMDWSILVNDDLFTRIDALHTVNDCTVLITDVPMMVGNGEDVAARHVEFGAVYSSSVPGVASFLPSANLFLPFESQALIPCDPSSQEVEATWSLLGSPPIIPVQVPAIEIDLSIFNMQSTGRWASGYPPWYWAQGPLFSQLLGAVLTRSTWNVRSEPQSIQIFGAGDNQEMRLDRRHPPPSQITLVQTLLLESSKALTGKSDARFPKELPSTNTVQDRLLSLLPENMQQDQSGNPEAIVAGDALFNLPFYTALLYSIANGFAGLEGIPPGAVLRVLKQNHRMSDQIINCLKSCSSAQARCLSDNLFKAAIEACDEEAVKTIIETTRDLQCSIDVNEIVCKINNTGRSYTAIELAAKLGHLGIVQGLLAAKADVNKTYVSRVQGQPQGALECAICTGGRFGLEFIKDQPVRMTIVVVILDHGVKLRLKLFEALIWHNPAVLLREIFSRLPANDHRQFFPMYSDESQGNLFREELLALIAAQLENILATEIIRRLLEQCSETNCMRCIKDHEQLERILCVAVRRTNIELVNILLPFTERQNGALAAAIRSGSLELIEFFISRESAVVSIPFCLDGHRLSRIGICKSYHGCTALSTPLAEAIRAQDHDLLQQLESRGILSTIDSPGHLQLAVNAAAQVGDFFYVEKLLQLTQNKDSFNIQSAVCAAIDADDMRMVMLLLESGCRFANDLMAVPGHASIPLLLALDTKNLAALNAIIEAEISGNFFKLSHSYKSVLELAVLWGDVSVVKSMISMGAILDDGLDDTALGVSIKSRNTETMRLLLNAGASPDACTRRGSETPLGLAIRYLNKDAIQLLLFHGASVADEWAFQVALREGQEMFDELLQAFSCRYPHGRRGFGGDLLKCAIERGDAKLFKKMLAAHFDTKNFGPYGRGSQSNAFGFAIMSGRPEGGISAITQELIDREDLNSIVMRTAMCDPAKKGFFEQETALLVAIETRNELLVTRLLVKGADIHQQARMGIKRTPLQRACEIGSFKMVMLLLEHGARVDDGPAYSNGRTALQLAAMTGSIKIAELLIQRGAFVHEPPATLRGQTAFEEAAKNGRLEMLRLLWDTVGGEGFDSAQIESAKCLALDGGHRGCAEYIDSLWALKNLSNLYLF